MTHDLDPLLAVMTESQSSNSPSPAEKRQGAIGNQQITDRAARMILPASFGLFAIYAVVVGSDSFPLRLLDPLWMVTAATSLVNAVSIPLVGVALVHVAAALAPLDSVIDQRRRLISRLSALAALGFLLLLPLLSFAIWKGVSNVNQGVKLQAVALNRAAGKLIQAIDQASSPQDLQKKMVSLQGPPINDRDLVRPLAELKQTQKQIINQLVPNLISQIPKPTSDTYKPLYVQALRSALLSLVSSLAFASLAYDPLKQQTLLQRLIRPQSAGLSGRHRGGFFSRISKQLDQFKRSTSTDAAAAQRLAEWRRRQKESDRAKKQVERSQSLRDRDMKRNLAQQRKLSQQREKKRQLAESEARRNANKNNRNR